MHVKITNRIQNKSVHLYFEKYFFSIRTPSSFTTLVLYDKMQANTNKKEDLSYE